MSLSGQWRCPCLPQMKYNFADKCVPKYNLGTREEANAALYARSASRCKFNGSPPTAC